MRVDISHDDCRSMQVERDGASNSFGRQGFDIWIGGVFFHWGHTIFLAEITWLHWAQAFLVRVTRHSTELGLAHSLKVGLHLLDTGWRVHDSLSEAYDDIAYANVRKRLGEEWNESILYPNEAEQ